VFNQWGSGAPLPCQVPSGVRDDVAGGTLKRRSPPQLPSSPGNRHRYVTYVKPQVRGPNRLRHLYVTYVRGDG